MTKHTKKFTIGLIVSLIGPGMIFAGCGYSIDSIEITEASNENRFVKVKNISGAEWDVYADRETGVMYAVSDGMYNRGNFTLLVDANGDPLIYKGAEE